MKHPTSRDTRRAIDAYYAALQSEREAYLRTPEGDAQRRARNARLFG